METTPVIWTDQADVFGAESTADTAGHHLLVSTVVTSSDELEVGWFVFCNGLTVAEDFILPSSVGGLRAAFTAAKAAAERALA